MAVCQAPVGEVLVPADKVFGMGFLDKKARVPDKNIGSEYFCYRFEYLLTAGYVIDKRN